MIAGFLGLTVEKKGYPQRVDQNVTIDRATTADVEALAPLLDAYREFYRQPSDLPRSREFIRTRLERGESVVFVARVARASDAAQVVAFAQLYPTFSSVTLGDRWVLNDLFVRPDHRRLGLGRLLTERAMRHARETGAHSIMLLTEVTNLSAQRLYESLGWSRDTTYFRYTWKP